MPPLTFPPEYPEILADLATLIHGRLVLALPPATAADLARELADDVRMKWGGGLIYIPKGDRYERHQRDAAIWREFNSRNHSELARRYGLGVAHVYKIIARERAHRQGRLFT